MHTKKMRLQHIVSLVAGLSVAVFACNYATDAAFGGPGQDGSVDPSQPPGSSGDPGSDGSSGGGGSSSGSKPPPPPTCFDGLHNAGEADVDCGEICQNTCAVGKGCNGPVDCDSKVCASGRCQPATGNDGVQNGDEVGVDCGGVQTGAPGCAVGHFCNTGADCASRGCSLANVCVAAPSCVGLYGASTCGAGEVGSGAEQHESCCTSIDVPGFEDPSRPGQVVSLDKYEITAGRMRAFVEAIAAQNAGVPNLFGFISGNRPARWADRWTPFLASSAEGGEADTPYGGLHAEAGGSGYGCGARCNVGTNYVFGAILYQYSHGHNCYHGGNNSFGFSTYWYPDDVMTNQNGGRPRVYSKEELDVKSLNCTPSLLFQAFCHWDGGQLATAEVLNHVAQGGLPAASQAIRSADGSQTGGYYYPPRGSDTDDAARVGAPGRWQSDATSYQGAGPWMDLRGNLNEIMLSGAAFALTPTFGGLAEGSAHAGGNNPEWVSHPEHKTALVGGRCMRFR